jgi:general secretion pathway protein J
MIKHHSRYSEGFTLLEILVALGIVAIVALLSWQGLQEVLRMRDRLQQVDDQLQTTTAVFSQLEQDIGSVERGIPKGRMEQDNVTLSINGLLILHTTRQAGLPSVQRQTAWVWQDNQLVRTSRISIEPESEVTSEPIALKGLRIRLWQEGQGWSSPQNFGSPLDLESEEISYSGRPILLQPNQGNNPEEGASQLIRAVEILITLNNGESVTRVVNVGGIY